MNLLSLDGLSKSLGESPLFEGVSLGIDSGDRIGFVGRNGCGKSSFLRVLSGGLEPDAGTVARKRGLSFSFLEQRHDFAAGETLGDFLYRGHSSAAGPLASRRALSGSDSHDHAALARLDAELEALGASATELAYASLCTELGLPSRDTPLSTFSGGMVKKAAMARALAPGAELLLLDEPTNHLDIETIEWLERRLLAGGSAFVLVTHDRAFLDAVCSSIMEIDRGRIYLYPGGYADFIRRRLEREASLEKAESRRLTILKREMAWLMRGARARATKSERRKGEIKDMQASGLSRERRMEGFSSGRRRLGKKILSIRGASKRYGERIVLAPFSREFKAGERIGLVGPNGSGKTTFLDLVAQRTAPDTGSIERGETVHFAYFDQTAADLDGGMSLLSYVEEHAERVRMADGSTLTAPDLLERFLFPRAVQGLPLSRLSGGELRRLQLVRLLAESPNFLLLDEPTNDLDIETIELLEDFVADFEGCVLAVSHDRAFLDGMADFIIALDGSGGLAESVGGYSDYRALAGPRPASGRAGAAKTDPAATAEGSAADRPAGRADSRRRSSDRPRLGYAERREYEGLLDLISALEGEKAELESLFSAPAPDPEVFKATNRRYAELGNLIEEKTARWEELASRDGDQA
ncbi:MAG TPA: ABC-F family ATP-binding cassette domain-containing protein [Rectinemataceae bacterium]|nr:ABC-F family ATP-binding cassette domain-containing protein [Rectinemataceae bacterium]